MTISTFSGRLGVSGNVEGNSSTATYTTPVCITIDSDGNLFVTDGLTIRKITPAGISTTFASLPPDMGIVGPGDLQVDLNNNLYAGMWGCITKITPAGVVSPYRCNVSTPLASETVFEVQGIAIDCLGNIFYTNAEHHSLFKIPFNSTTPTTFAGPSSPDNTLSMHGMVDGTGSAVRFFRPTRMAINESNVIYLIDSANFCIRKILPTGEVNIFAGSATGASGNVDGLFTAARFESLRDITIDGDGNVYVLETSSVMVRIRKITPTSTVSTIYSHIPGTAASNQLNSASSLVINTDGSIYITDFRDRAIKKITPFVAPAFCFNVSSTPTPTPSFTPTMTPTLPNFTPSQTPTLTPTFRTPRTRNCVDCVYTVNITI